MSFYNYSRQNFSIPTQLWQQIAGKFGLIIVRVGELYQLQDPHNIENSYPDLMTWDEMCNLLRDAAEMKKIL